MVMMIIEMTKFVMMMMIVIMVGDDDDNGEGNIDEWWCW